MDAAVPGDIMAAATESARETAISGRVTPEVSPMLFKTTLPLRFWSKVYADPSGCWIWDGARHPLGYGNFNIGGGKYQGAHRACFEALVGVVAPGFELDHLCRVPPCVNPLHVESVTHRVNVLRGAAPKARAWRENICLRGHSLITYGYVRKDRAGRRQCKLCRNILRNQARVVAKEGRLCLLCQEPIPLTRRIDSGFCSSLCRRRQRWLARHE